MKIRRQQYWSIHTHSEYSAADAMGTVASIVERARELGYKGLALTDHGNIAGSVELYHECKRHGIKPFPGSEMYLVEDRADKKAKRYHFCVIAYTTEGYRNLVHLSTLSHKNFYHKPIVDLNDLAQLSEEGKTKGLAMTTGCYFGYITQKLLNDGPAEARRVIKAFIKWFDVFIELQRHNVDANEEDWVTSQLLNISDDLGLPIVLGQDSHYTHPHHQETHDTLKEMLTWSENPDDAKFPGDGYHMVDDQWMIDHHGQETFDRAMEGHAMLLEMWDLVIPEMDEYAYRIPSISSDPAKALRDMCYQQLQSRHEMWVTDGYTERLESELETVHAAGMEDYFLLVSEVCQWMQGQGIEYQTRGSAAGSLIAYLLGITNVDPVKWGTSFDRFMGRPMRTYTFELGGEMEGDDPVEIESLSELSLMVKRKSVEHPKWVEEELALLASNPKAFDELQRIAATETFYTQNTCNSAIAYELGITEEPYGPPEAVTILDRKSPPDIDLDVDNQRRGEVLEWLDERFSVSPIGNWSEMGFKTDATGEQIDNSAGSVVVKYKSAKRKRLRAKGMTAGEIEERLKWANLASSEKQAIQDVSDMKPFSGAGTHACGLILTNSSDEMDTLVPRMWIPNSKAMVSQFHMKQVESIGLVKLDLLGSKTMTVMARVAKELGYENIEVLKSEKIEPYSDKNVFRAMGRGDTEGVFQLEGYASMLGVKRMKPKSIKDVIAAMALFRPASEGAGATDEFLKRRSKEEDTPERHPLIERVIGDTNGVILYQDQIIGVLRALGMNPTDLTIFLKAIKASNKNQASAGKTIDTYMPIIKQMFKEHGIPEDDWEWFEHTCIAATGYGFNLAHATVYGITAYVTQWMQVHHPDVFFSNLITVHLDDPKKVEKYEAAARKRRVRILRADVYESHSTDYRVVKPGVIRRPLQGIKGVGKVAAQCILDVQDQFKNAEDFLGLVNPSKVTGVKDYDPDKPLKGTLKALVEAGAIDL